MAGVAENVIIPYYGIEFDPTRAFTGPTTLPFNALIMGHQLPTGTLVDNDPVQVFNEDEVASLAGVGSMLHQLAVRWFSRNKGTSVYIVAIPLPAGGAAEVYTQIISGTAIESGTFPTRLDGELFTVGVSTGDTASDVATAMVLEVNDAPEKSVFSAANTAGSIDYTPTYTGELSSAHDIRDVYYATDKLPKGLSVAYSSTGGAGTPDISTAITNIENYWFNVIVMPFNDTGNLDIMETELLRRFGPDVQKSGMCYFGYAEDPASSIIFSTDTSRNNQLMNMVDSYKYTQHNMFVACLVASEVAKATSSDAGSPLHNIVIDNLLPPVPKDRSSTEVLNNMSNNGITTLNPEASGGPATYGMVTMYINNTSGFKSIAYRQQYVLFILEYLRYDLNAFLSTRYGQSRLADNAERIRAGIKVITPNIMKQEIIGRARLWETEALVENVDLWKDQIDVARSSSNPDRLNYQFPPDLINHFIVSSGIIQFVLDEV